ncbi:RhoGAP domain [Popillia japonica]|uniref:RhoGAP domain n=1 Tax=Popillia japonica TaxID=7064 RepID=A0AAW1KQP8_POPJA
MRHSPSIVTTTPASPAAGVASHNSSPSPLANIGPASIIGHSPSVTSLQSRASPSPLMQSNASRSSSPAMQATSAGLAVTLATTTPAFTTLTGLQSTISNINTTANNIYNLNYSQQPTTYASTNPFLTGAYLNYTPGDMFGGDKYNTIGPTKIEPKPFAFSSDSYQDNQKYATLNTKMAYDQDQQHLFSSADRFSSMIGVTSANNMKYQEKSSYLSGGEKSSFLTSGFGTELKYSPGSRDSKTSSSYDTSPNVTQSSSLLGVEETPTPTSSIETEDSNTREVGEKDVEGDGEQSD